MYSWYTRRNISLKRMGGKKSFPFLKAEWLLVNKYYLLKSVTFKYGNIFQYCAEKYKAVVHHEKYWPSSTWTAGFLIPSLLPAHCFCHCSKCWAGSFTSPTLDSGCNVENLWQERRWSKEGNFWYQPEGSIKNFKHPFRYITVFYNL